jgi:hypothetical protein
MPSLENIKSFFILFFKWNNILFFLHNMLWLDGSELAFKDPKLSITIRLQLGAQGVLCSDCSK